MVKPRFCVWECQEEGCERRVAEHQHGQVSKAVRAAKGHLKRFEHKLAHIIRITPEGKKGQVIDTVTLEEATASEEIEA